MKFNWFSYTYIVGLRYILGFGRWWTYSLLKYMCVFNKLITYMRVFTGSTRPSTPKIILTILVTLSAEFCGTENDNDLKNPNYLVLSVTSMHSMWAWLIHYFLFIYFNLFYFINNKFMILMIGGSWGI
jgi:hypothetical protein